MAERSFTVRLSARVDSYVNAIKQAERTTHNFSRTTQRNMGHIGRQMQSFGRMTTVAVTVPIVGLGAAAIKSGLDWESAFTGVRKTVDGTASQMANLEAELRSMTSAMPASHKEIAAVAEAAGQLGIKAENIAQFTEVMVKLGDTTNVVGQEGAINMARFMNVMQTTPERINELGAVLVHLGNNTATTEAEILELSTRIAGAGKIAGLSESDVMALAAAITSVGVKAEAGGTATSKFLLMMKDAVLEGGDALKTLANVSGVSMDEFSRLFKDDAAQAFTIFIEGLRRVADSGKAVTPIFRDLGVADERLMRAMRDTANAGPLLAEALDLANTAAAEGTALNEEAAKRYETTAARLGMLRNKAVDLGIDISAILLPAFEAAMSIMGGLIDAFDALPVGIQAAVIGVLALAAAVGPTVWIMGTLVRNIQTLSSVMAATKWASILTPMGMLAGALTVVAGAYLLVKSRTETSAEAMARLAEKAEETRAAVAQLAEELRGMDDPNDALRSRLIELADTSDDFIRAMRGAGLTIDDLVDKSMLGGKATGGLSLEIQKGAREAGLSEEATAALGGEVGNIISMWREAQLVLGNVNEVQGESVEVTDEYSEETVEAAEAVEVFQDAIDALIGELEAERDALQGSVDALQERISAYRGAADASFALRDAEDNLIEAVEDLDAALGDGELRLENHAEFMRNIAQAQDTVAESARDVADANVRLADEQATLEGRILSSTEKLDIFNDSLLTQAANAEGPARAAILNYIGTVNDIPRDVLTIIEALIEEGKLEEAEAVLEFMSRSRPATVKADADQAALDATESELNRLARDRTMNVTMVANGNAGHLFLDKGGMGYPGDIVAERGPEIVDGRLVIMPTMLTRPARVTGREDTARMFDRRNIMDGLTDSKSLTPMPSGMPFSPPAANTDSGTRIGVHVENLIDQSGHSLEDVFRVANAHLLMGV